MLLTLIKKKGLGKEGKGGYFPIQKVQYIR